MQRKVLQNRRYDRIFSYSHNDRQPQQRGGQSTEQALSAPTSSPPARFCASRTGTFADFTVEHRLPKIIKDIVDDFAGQLELSNDLNHLIDEIICDKYINISYIDTTSIWFINYLSNISGLKWREIPFFELEMLFYIIVNKICSRYDINDPFQKKKIASLDSVYEKKFILSQLSISDDISNKFKDAAFANENDLSLLETNNFTDENRRFLIDEIELWNHKLNRNKVTKIGYIADNAGLELAIDLSVIASILNLFPDSSINLFLKPEPIFVSDATVEDFHHTIRSFKHKRETERFAHQLQMLITDGRLTTSAELDWTEPRYFSEFSPSLVRKLQNFDGVISKGDLNYRRFVGDREWPPVTAQCVATSGVNFSALNLRTLKSEALVGAHSQQMIRLEQRPKDRTNGYFVLAQILGK